MTSKMDHIYLIVKHYSGLTLLLNLLLRWGDGRRRGMARRICTIRGRWGRSWKG